MSTGTDQPRGTRAVSILGIVAALLLIGASIFAYRLLVRAPVELAHATADGIREMFQVTPRVSVNEVIIIEQATPILELGTVSRQMMVDHEWSHSWLGSTKTLHVRGIFKAAAGYNLKEPFSIEITSDPLKITALLPEPRLLSVQMDSFMVVTDESGWWNRITEADRSEAVMALVTVAKKKALTSGILDDVRSSAEDRIRELVQRNGAEVIFERPGKPQ
jgi:hypothetical protein